MNTVPILDGDGHIFEDLAGIEKFLPGRYKQAGRPLGVLYPGLDQFHIGSVVVGRTPPEAFGGGKPVGPKEWRRFMEEVGIESAVLYPTAGLAYGRITDIDYAIDLARAYNDWLAETYVKEGKLFQGIALIPMQEPEAAAEELRRSVRELGMCGAMLPSVGLKMHLGSREYFPVYREAEQLGCVLAAHGGDHGNLGFDDLNVFAAVHALGHPFGMMIGLAAMVFNGVWDRFPGLRVGFLEAGVAWLGFCLERFDGSYGAFTPYNARGELLKLPEGQKISDYIIRLIRSGNIGIGCEGDEPDLPHLVRRVGVEPFLFSSDYPHEVNAGTCKEEIGELLENEALTQQEKQAILRGNAERFYKVGVPTPVA